VDLRDGGNDTAYGLAGVDTFYFGAAFTAADAVDGGGGNDVLALQGNYGAGLTFGTGTTGNITSIESISLYSGNNAQFGDTSNSLYSYNLTMLDGNVADGAVLKVNGAHLRSGENLTFNGSAETNGSFLVYGGLGIDIVTGGGKGDSFVFAHDGRFGAGDTVNGGAGYDVVYLRGDYNIDFNNAGLGGSLTNIESIGLLSATETLYAGGGDGEFDYVLTWNDVMLATGATMVVNGSRLKSAESMTFDGSSEAGGNFRLFGGLSADTLTGGGGNDLIFGNAGADTLTGNGGADTFRYQALSDSVTGSRDTIEDFLHGTDKIDLSFIDANSFAGGNQTFRFINSDAFGGTGSASAGQLRAFNLSGNIWQVEGDTDGDGNADIVIQVEMIGPDPLNGSDFIF
jgi:hypothetical protein